jgi:SM-20-related protein
MRISTHSTNFEELVDHVAEHGFCVINDFLPEATVTALANEAQTLKQTEVMQVAGIGREHLNVNKEIRGDSIYWLNEDEATAAQQSYFEQMESLRLNLNRHLYLGLFGLESHLAVYPEGGFYKKHLDCFASQNPQKPQRKISCIVYLNHDWHMQDGGQLKLYLNETDESDKYKSILISPLAGRAVIFLSDTFYHEVMPTYKERISLTGWFLSRPQQ